MRRIPITIALTLAASLLLGTVPVAALTRTTESIPPVSGVELTDFCGGGTSFSPVINQRETRQVTTWVDQRGSTILQTFRTKTATEFANRDLAISMLLNEDALLSIRPNSDGSNAMLFAGEGAVWGTDTSLGRPFILWITGLVLMRGSYDSKTGILTVSSKRIVGLSTDLCGSLSTGLKPRH
jgi:hypothetical protein